MGGWLPGLRRARRRRAVEQETVRMRETSQSTEDSVNTMSKKEGPCRQHVKDDLGYFVFDQPNGPSEDANIRREALSSLRAVAARSVGPTPKPMPKHILITVSPLKVHADGISDRQCVFLAGVFSVPNDEQARGPAHGEILCGLDSWGARPIFHAMSGAHIYTH